MKTGRAKDPRPARTAKPNVSGANAKPVNPGEEFWNLCFYVAGLSAESAAAFRNLKQICEEHLAGRYHIEVIDLVKNPKIAREHQIVALPAVVRKRPLPLRKLIGDMSDTARTLAGLDLGGPEAQFI